MRKLNIECVYIHDESQEKLLNIPQISYNLICVPCLALHLHCHLVFDVKHYLIQDIQSKRMIGAAMIYNSLYLLNALYVQSSPFRNAICYVNTNTSIHFTKPLNVGHLRLGHPSHDKLMYIHNLFSFVPRNNPSTPCDTCFFAKKNIYLFLIVILLLLTALI